MRHGIDAGLTYFDTSPLYGHGMSQAIYGTALTDGGEGFLFATKLGHFRNPALYRSADALRAQLNENLRLLRREQLDLLQVHEADFQAWRSDDWVAGRICEGEDYDFAGAPVVEVLREARDQVRVPLHRHLRQHGIEHGPRTGCPRRRYLSDRLQS